ncbi:MAG: hypothetical protein HYU64_13825 [Armatimonadetes bacterium]|nr:hypothetical protein [Armatimonadota bacterium]
MKPESRTDYGDAFLKTGPRAALGILDVTAAMNLSRPVIESSGIHAPLPQGLLGAAHIWSGAIHGGVALGKMLISDEPVGALAALGSGAGDFITAAGLWTGSPFLTLLGTGTSVAGSIGWILADNLNKHE